MCFRKIDVALKDSGLFLYFFEEADLRCRLEDWMLRPRHLQIKALL